MPARLRRLLHRAIHFESHPGMPQGKPAGSRCVQLDDDMRCRIFGHPDRPDVCSSLQPSTELCADDREQAMTWLLKLEELTLPAR